MIIPNFSPNEIIDICIKEQTLFVERLQGIHYDIKGILNSEMLLFCALSKYLNPSFVIESGRARGNSTEVLARFFESMPDLSVISLEYLKYTEDSLMAMRRLCKYRNLSLRFGNAFSLLPALCLSRTPCTVLIDGPKGKYALLLAAHLLTNPQVKAVFVHDLPQGYYERELVDNVFPHTFSSDDKNFVDAFSYLDEVCWAVYKKWKGYEDWGPYKRGEHQMLSYGPTMTMILNTCKGINKEQVILEEFDLRPVEIYEHPVRRVRHFLQTNVPSFQQLSNFIEFYSLKFRRYK